jgi:hypothetical protein
MERYTYLLRYLSRKLDFDVNQIVMNLKTKLGEIRYNIDERYNNRRG